MGITPVDGGFAVPVGNKLETVIDVTGPSSYVAGTGQQILATEVGMVGVDQVIAGVSTDGTYTVVGKVDGGGKSASSGYLTWFVVATGLEAGAIDLSGSTVRVVVKGI